MSERTLIAIDFDAIINIYNMAHPDTFHLAAEDQKVEWFRQQLVLALNEDGKDEVKDEDITIFVPGGDR